MEYYSTNQSIARDSIANIHSSYLKWEKIMARMTSNLTDLIKDNLLVIIIVSGLLLLCICFGWTYYNSEKVTYTSYKLKERAVVNPYYATELFLNQEHQILKSSGKNSTNKFAYSKLDMDLPNLIEDLPSLKQKPTLIIKRIGKSLDTNQTKILLDWIEQGGHLITFSSKTSLVLEKDWEKVKKRLSVLNKDPTRFSQFVQEDKQLNDLLNDINQDADDEFLQNLGIYNVDSKLSSNEKIEKKLEGTKNFRIRHHEQIVTIQNEKDGAEPITIMINSWYSNLDSSLFFLLNPQASMRQEISIAKSPDIQKYLIEQIKKLNSYIISYEKFKQNNPERVKNLPNPKEQKKFLESLLKLSDKELSKLFGINNNTFLDANYGKGRITVLNESKILENPKSLHLQEIQARHSFLDGKIEKSILISSIVKLEMFSDHKSLYSNENAVLLKTLIQDSPSVWLFSRISIDGLPILLWKNARLAVIGLFILIIVWIWSLYNRFGKRQYLDNSQETDIFLYFRQIGKYGWGVDNAKKLSNPVRKQAMKIISRSLDLKANEPLKKTHMRQLSKLLYERLSHKININDDISLDFHKNESYINQLLNSENLQAAIFSTNRDLKNLKEYQFVQHTQTLWLVKWLLK